MQVSADFRRGSSGIATDATALHGRHVFEAGLLAGRATPPFRLVGVEFRRGTCDHCGRVLACCCEIVGANGFRFTVGSGCVAKTGDAGLFRAYRNSPEVRRVAREKAAAKYARVYAELAALISQHEVALRAAPHPYGFDGQTAYDGALFVLKNMGTARKADLVQSLKSGEHYALTASTRQSK